MFDPISHPFSGLRTALDAAVFRHAIGHSALVENGFSASPALGTDAVISVWFKPTAASLAPLIDMSGHYHLRIEKTGSTVTYKINDGTPQAYGGSVGTSFHELLENLLIALCGSSHGYYADLHAVDRTTADPFGSVSPTVSTLWTPRVYAGEYSAGGSHLDFADAANLGRDVSGNGNHWTVNGSPVQTLDTPTDNYSTLNPATTSDSAVSYANGNTTASVGGTSGRESYSTHLIPPGKWYIESETDAGNAGSSSAFIGLRQSGNGDQPFYYRADGTLVVDGASVGTFSAWSGGDVLGLLLDTENDQFEVRLNNAVIHAGSYSTDDREILLHLASANGGAQTVNFGATGFAYGPPVGYSPLSSANLPEPEPLDPAKGVDIVLRSGTGADATVSGLGFAPDFVLTKGRDAATSWGVFDTCRGATHWLAMQSADADRTDAESLKAFAADGYTMGSSTFVNYGDGRPYVDFCLKRGPEFGFDIVPYVGDGIAGKQLAHNCGGVPELIIVKNITTNGQNWMAYHSALGATKLVYPNLDNALVTSSAGWSDTEPTNTHFTVGHTGNTNEDGSEHIAYVFRSVPGFSRVFSYTGNADTDGPFVDLGFTPLAMMMKNASATENWRFYDTARDPESPVDRMLQLNLSNAEMVAENFRFHAGGMKVVSSFGSVNGGGHRHVGMAWAAQPFKYSNAF